MQSFRIFSASYAKRPYFVVLYMQSGVERGRGGPGERDDIACGAALGDDDVVGDSPHDCPHDVCAIVVGARVEVQGVGGRRS